MRSLIKVLMMLSCFLLLAGCGAEYEEADPAVEGRLTVHSDGHVDAHVCGEFSKDYYSEDELVQMVNEEIAAYDGRITLAGHSSGNGVVTLDLTFGDCDAYEDYMTLKLFNGNVQGAYDKGYDFNRVLKRAGNPEDIISKEQLNNMADAKIIIFEGAQTCVCPGNVKYYSQELKLINQNTVQSAADGIYYIIY
ncbi:MAG: hypothetical protein K6B44_01275 [Lachnospiraceae bacterium]|nr:hypothetical protein [Lachnospiraceae bacterium]